MTFLKDPRHRAWTALALLALLLLSLAGPFVVGRDARHLSAYRDGGEDASLALAELSGAASRVDAILGSAHALADVDDPARALYVAIGVERAYDPSEAAAVLDFLRRGGSVLLADEGGYGTQVAREAGFAFGEQTLLDTRNHLGDPKLVVTTARLDGRDFRILLNAPTELAALTSAGAHDVLASSSPATTYPDGSYLDVNANGEIDLGDRAGPFPLVVRTRVGEGTLVLVADTGLFMNRQASLIEYGNAAFVGALAQSLVPRDGVVLLDESRHAPPAPLAPYDNAVRAVSRATSGVVAPAILLALLVLCTLVAWRATQETQDWSHHDHDVGRELPAPAQVRPDLGRAQRMARRRISERFNMPLEQVAAMPAEQLLSLTGDRLLAEAAAGTLRSDPTPLFRELSSSTPRPEATP